MTISKAELRSRAADKKDLRWLQKRCAGQSPKQIAKEEGASFHTISKVTNDIRKADLAHSPGANVAAAYWPDGRGVR
ncbi:hypothetical protein [Thalassovita sp.]|uniref:hypothetical protein n=1 Tax=Thalassovita sp. TaxID=1979401 RepID=UPI002AB1A219|nr:hypothetical protein [Thalassovita sp.]